MINQKEKPFFSVITVTLNNIDGLKKTYKSLLCQSCKDYEWVVMDGGSNDGTKEFLEGKADKWVSQSDHGIYDAMNNGIYHSNGKYLIFMNSGDCFATPKTLLLIKESVKEHLPEFIYGDSMEDQHFKKARHHSKINQGMITHHQAMAYKTPLEPYNLDYRIAADYDLTLSVINNSENILYIPEPLCLFESGGLSQQKIRQGRIEQFKIRHKHGISIFKNSLVFISQTLLYQLRRFFPSLYWFLKQR
jgi:putative colanic acid biosynthesis glycosyltransferase